LQLPSLFKAEHLEGIVEADETFFLESRKIINASRGEHTEEGAYRESDLTPQKVLAMSADRIDDVYT